MAELALFSLASRLLSKIASPSFKKAYESVRSILGARDDLDQLRLTIETIQYVLLDAEKQQESSAAVKNWIKRVKVVLYEADDLFDEIATDDLLKQQIKGNKLLKEVRGSVSKLTCVVSNVSVAKKVKAIKKSLEQISKDMAQYNFVQSRFEEPISGLRKGVETGFFVDPDEVVGRDEDKKAILGFLLDGSNAELDTSLVAIVGIGGMGKTTLAQLVYNHKMIEEHFPIKWWACISDVLDEKEIIGRISQSITGESYHNSSMSQLEFGIRQSISRNETFLLVLDDLWDENHSRGMKLRALLRSGAKGSKIIVTTRCSSVASAMNASQVHALEGLSEEMSWHLFKRLAFMPGQEEDPNRERIGKEIVKKCANVPLAIAAIANLLYIKNSIAEWEFLKNNEISQMEQSVNRIMFALKLSYNHLPSNLKHCFAYCSLFPKDYKIVKDDLIQLWISQGYVHVDPSNKSQTLEDVGHMYFMELLRRSFFQEVGKGSDGQILSCKMHDLVHDLATFVAGEETVMLARQTDQFNGPIRHLAFDRSSDNLPILEDPCCKQLLDLPVQRITSVRSLFNLPILDQRITKFRSLRALTLSDMGIQEITNSIGDLKHLRYLDLTYNDFTSLPDSITNLVNLLTLKLRSCHRLKALPNDFRKLINLRHFYDDACGGLSHMPPGFGELTSLQHLSYFKVGKAKGGGKSSRVDALAGLKLRGDLEIYIDCNNDWNEDELMLEMSRFPAIVNELGIIRYPGTRIPSLLPCVVKIFLSSCKQVKHLRPFRWLPHLKNLILHNLDELEYVEEDEEKNEGGQGVTAAADSAKVFFPCLERLHLLHLPKLKGWSRKIKADLEEEAEHSTSTCASPHQMPSFPLLSSVMLYGCGGLISFPGEALTSLRHLDIRGCSQLKNVYLPPPHLNLLEHLMIWSCRELELWEEEKRGVDWDSLPNLRTLSAGNIPDAERLPDCLRHRQALGKFYIHKGGHCIETVLVVEGAVFKLPG